jgi:hypothetical protein
MNIPCNSQSARSSPSCVALAGVDLGVTEGEFPER